MTGIPSATEYLERGYRNLNASVLKQISKALEHDPTADIESVLNKVYTSYAKFRKNVEERQAKREAKRRTILDDRQEEYNPTEISRPSYPGVLFPFAAFIQAPLPTSAELHLCTLRHSTIVYPLSPMIRDMLKLTDTPDRECDLSHMVLRLVSSGTTLWEFRHSCAVVQISDNVVVKIAQNLDHDEHGVLQFLEEHLPSVAKYVPRPLGLITIGSTSFMFMTKLAGTTLESRWPSLSTDAKMHIRRVLDLHLNALRNLEHPLNSPFGSPVGRCLCKDTRRDIRMSASSIYTESQFNDFLLDSPTSRAAPGHKKWLRSMLRTDHRIVFTHADFHPRNIMVVDGPGGIVELSGILDWEMSGFYPEYWEHLKAMNTRSFKDSSDWWDHLPPCILGYDQAVVLDQIIEATVIY